MSSLSIDEMVSAISSLCTHHTSGTVWFGYLEGWMLTPQEEVRLRPALRQFHCLVVARHPTAFSYAWKNEIDTIYTSEDHQLSNGHSDTDHDGGSL
jgi:hypothetical protein